MKPLFMTLSITLLPFMAAANPYSNLQYRNTLSLPSFQEMSIMTMYLEEQHQLSEQRNLEYLNALVEWCFKLQRQQADKIFTDDVAKIYKYLKSCYDKDLHTPSMSRELKKIELSVRDAILAYNERLQREYAFSHLNAKMAFDTNLYHSIPQSSKATLIIGAISKGAYVTILDEKDGYYKIRYGNYEGYVVKAFVHFE